MKFEKKKLLNIDALSLDEEHVLLSSDILVGIFLFLFLERNRPQKRFGLSQTAAVEWD